MEAPTPSISILVTANDGEVDEAPHELFNSWLVPVSSNKTSLAWQYFAMVNDEQITCNGI
jgi:hypothetical protein